MSTPAEKPKFELAAAIVEAQAETKNPKKDASNPFFQSKYLSLAGLLDAVLPVYNKHGIAILQDITSVDGMVSCTTILSHKNGESARFGPLAIPTQKADAQAFGSAVSYARRYHLQSVLGIAAEDDDGERAMKRSVELPKIAAPSLAAQVAALPEGDPIAVVVTGADWKGRVGKGPYKVSTPEGVFSTFDEPMAKSIAAGSLVVYRKTRFGMDIVKVENKSETKPIADDDESVPF